MTINFLLLPRKIKNAELVTFDTIKTLNLTKFISNQKTIIMSLEVKANSSSLTKGSIKMHYLIIGVNSFKSDFHWRGKFRTNQARTQYY